MSDRFFIDDNADGKKDNNEWVHPGVSTKSVSNLIPNNNDNYAVTESIAINMQLDNTDSSKGNSNKNSNNDYKIMKNNTMNKLHVFSKVSEETNASKKKYDERVQIILLWDGENMNPTGKFRYELDDCAKSKIR